MTSPKGSLLPAREVAEQIWAASHANVQACDSTIEPITAAIEARDAQLVEAAVTSIGFAFHASGCDACKRGKGYAKCAFGLALHRCEKTVRALLTPQEGR